MRTPALCLAAALLGLVATAVHADEIRLRNGDRLTGTIVRKSGANLVVRTDYAGELTVRWSEVEAIATAKPIRLQAQGAEKVVAVTLAPAAAGEAALAPAPEGEATLPLDRIAYLNPTPAESGEGMVVKRRITLAASATGGNTDTSRLYGEADVEGAAKTSRFSFTARAEQQKDRDTTGAANWRMSGEYDRFIAPRRFLYARSSLEQDRLSDIRLRAAAGGGHGWQLVDSPDTALSLRTGLDYVVVNHMEAPDEHFPALGLGVKFRHRLFGNRLEVFHEQEDYWNLDNTQDLTIISRTGVRLPIAPGLNANAQVNANWDGRPTDERKRLDTTLLFGAGYEW